MASFDILTIERLAESVEQAADLAAHAKYAELGEYSRILESRLAEMQAFRDELGAAPGEARELDGTGELAGACESLRQKAFMAGQILQHLDLVVSGLVEIGRAASGGYGPDGHCEAAEPSRLRTEG